MKNLFKIFIVILSLPLFLMGCWNYKDINTRSVNLSIGVDTKDNIIQYYGEFAKLMSEELEKGQAEITDVYNFKSSGDSFESTRANYNTRTSGLNFSGAIRAVVFSKNYAETNGIESYLNRINYVNDFRNSVLVAISDEPIKQLFDQSVENDISVGYSIENTIGYLSDNGRALYKSAQQIISDIRFKSVGYLLPYITRKDGTIKYLGFAVMKDSKMIGTIPSQDAYGFIFLISPKAFMTAVIPHPQYNNNLVNAKVFLNKRKIKTDYKDNHVVVDVDLKLGSEIMYEYELKPISDEDLKLLQTAISNNVKNQIMEAVNKSTKEFKCDLFDFARYFKGSHYTKFKKIDWEKEYENMTVNINVETTIRHSNVLDPNAKVPTAKKK